MFHTTIKLLLGLGSGKGQPLSPTAQQPSLPARRGFGGGAGHPTPGTLEQHEPKAKYTLPLFPRRPRALPCWPRRASWRCSTPRQPLPSPGPETQHLRARRQTVQCRGHQDTGPWHLPPTASATSGRPLFFLCALVSSSVKRGKRHCSLFHKSW